MGQSLHNLLGRHSDTRLFTIPDSVDSGHEHLQNLLLQRTKLSNDIAQIRALLKKVSLNRSYSRASLKPKSSQRHHRSPSTSVRPARRELERACRIALMEAAEAISAENVYDLVAYQRDWMMAAKGQGITGQGPVNMTCRRSFIPG